MKKRFLGFVFFLILASPADSQKAGNAVHSSQGAFTFDFAKSTPKDLIALLKANRGTDHSNQVRFLDRAPAGWIKESDIGFLMTVIASSDTVSCFVSPFSSTACYNCYATLGGHAMEMIECYRQNTRFPSSFFNCPRTDPQKVKEITKWRETNWRTMKK